MRFKRYKILKDCKNYITPLKWFVLLLIISSLAALPVTLISPKLFQILIDDVMRKQSMSLFPVVVFGLFGIYGIRFLLDGINLFCSNKLINRFSFCMRKDIWNKYLSMRYEEYEKRDSGNLKMRFMDDVDCLGNFVKDQIVDFWCAILMIFFTLYMTYRISGKMLLICICIIPFVFFTDYLIGKGTGKINEKIRSVNEEYYAFEHNSLQFWKEIKAQCAEKDFIARFHAFRKLLAKLGLVNIRYWFYREVFNDFKANYLTKVFVYIVGSFFVMSGEITVGTLILFGEYFGILFTSLDTVNSKNVSLNVNMPYYRRIQETLQFNEEHEEKKQLIQLPCKIECRDLCFTYPSAENEVLHQVSVHLRKGDYIALIGESGGGKTTIAKLLLGLYKPQEGEITYDSVPLSQINKSALYNQIGVVMQDSYLFNMSIRENLQLANACATEEQLLEACRQASIYEFIRGLPKGLDTVIGERGVKLSGGQKQRIVIARALLKNPSMLIFDEATSSLDRLSEDQINLSINRLSQGHMVLVISHKPETYCRAKSIWEVKGGRIRKVS